MTKTITVRGVDYNIVSGEEAYDPAIKVLWSLLKIASTEHYQAALITKDPLSSWQEFSKGTRLADRDSIFLFELNLTPRIEPDSEKNSRVALEEDLRELVPDLPKGLGAKRLIEFINAVLPQEAEAQPEKKSRKKKGFGEKVEPPAEEWGLPALESIAGREVSPEELANAKFDGKTLEDVADTSMIGISDEVLAQLRPDLMTIEEQENQAALREQESYRLNVVSKPVPPDADELEDLI